MAHQIKTIKDPGQNPGYPAGQDGWQSMVDKLN